MNKEEKKQKVSNEKALIFSKSVNAIKAVAYEKGYYKVHFNKHFKNGKEQEGEYSFSFFKKKDNETHTRGLILKYRYLSNEKSIPSILEKVKKVLVN